mmetsp:Transcript_44220/g.116198  ORF Transcript_44220/g.116198 Transcript_44220/m.116198 type:complete len:225 (-) Transcript_44220:560-1234(-)
MLSGVRAQRVAHIGRAADHRLCPQECRRRSQCPHGLARLLLCLCQDLRHVVHGLFRSVDHGYASHRAFHGLLLRFLRGGVSLRDAILHGAGTELRGGLVHRRDRRDALWVCLHRGARRAARLRRHIRADDGIFVPHLHPGTRRPAGDGRAHAAAKGWCRGEAADAPRLVGALGPNLASSHVPTLREIAPRSGIRRYVRGHFGLPACAELDHVGAAHPRQGDHPL